MSFFHGIQVTEVNIGGVTVNIVNSAVIGLVGAAPQWLAAAGAGPGISKPTLVNSQAQASNFGPAVNGYSIPYALNAMQKQGAGAIIVIDVLNPLLHQTTFTKNPITGPASNIVPISLGHMGLVGPGLPNTPLATASVDAVSFPGGAVSHSYVVGDTITLAGGTFSVAAVLTVATTQLIALSLNSPGGSSTHSYAPGDGITLAGGTASQEPILDVITTQVIGATVAAGGSGGTNGTQTVTGTTGTGIKFQASVTVSGGAITAVLSISLAGNYSTNPIAIATEPVTGAGLVGAELAVQMGVLSFNIVNPGNFTVNSATFTQASTTGNGLGATFNAGLFGVLSASISTVGSYSAIPANPVLQGSTSGIGTGASFNMTFAGPPTTVVVKNQAASTTYTENTDYTIDYVNGLLYTKAGGAITVSEALQVTAAYCDPSKVLNTDIIGAVTGGNYTGMQGFLATFNTMGFFAKILCAPGFTDTTTASALLAIANSVRGYALIGAPPQTSVAQAIANRGVVGNAFNLASDRLALCFPHQLIQDYAINPAGVTISAQGVVQLGYGSATIESDYVKWVAGAMSANDVDNGFWFSPSNQPFIGTLGPDISMYMSAYDPNSDTNNLNAAGILTCFNGFGTGLRTWGNRSSSFPASPTTTTFACIRRTLDVVEQSIQVSSLPYLDRPITNGLIVAILAAVNGFIRTLIQQGALVPGSKISFNPADNPVQSLQAGQITFAVSLMPPPPAEEIIYNFYVNPSLLANLGAAVTSQSNQASVNPTA